MDATIKEQEHNIVPTHLIIKAMRDNGYKNAAYAVAELIDNAIQAGATNVELLCSEEAVQLEYRTRLRLKEIAVLDNGSGMDKETLWTALEFGNGTRLDPKKQTGIGKFGMGLPNSSISQAKRVDVWSWQNGIENAIHTYLDLDEFSKKQITKVPEPQLKEIPSVWQQVGSEFGNSGTLVVWTNIDRCMWQTAKSVIDNSELLIGRIYRYVLNDKSVKIRLVSFNTKNPDAPNSDRYAVPNDPLYLMTNTSCLAPFDNKPMFIKWGENSVFNVEFRGKKHSITVKFAIASQEAREGISAGDKPHGKHAAKNIGVSIIRAGRELDLDPTWTSPSDPRERWWGVEIDFPPALDDLFGVTNNKQSAAYFSYLATIDLATMVESNSDLIIELEKMSADEDIRLPILKIANHIKNQISQMRGTVSLQNKGQRTQKRYEDEDPKDISAEQKAGEVIENRKKQGHQGDSDAQETEPEQEKKDEIKETLLDHGFTENSAEQLSATLVNSDLKVIFDQADISTPGFFDRKSTGGKIFITINKSHPAYPYLNEVLEEEIPFSEQDDEELKELRNKFLYVREGLKLLLISWARLEDEAPDGELKQKIVDVRWDWGKMARVFLKE